MLHSGILLKPFDAFQGHVIIRGGRFIYPTRGVREFHGAAVNPGFYLSLDSDPCGCDEHECCFERGDECEANQSRAEND